jgi:hypothetical protein
MTQAEFFRASLKLIGIIFGIIAFGMIATAAASVAAISFRSGTLTGIESWYLEGLVQPVPFFVAAYLLIFKTRWCDRQLGRLESPTTDL